MNVQYANVCLQGKKVTYTIKLIMFAQNIQEGANCHRTLSSKKQYNYHVENQVCAKITPKPSIDIDKQIELERIKLELEQVKLKTTQEQRLLEQIKSTAHINDGTFPQQVNVGCITTNTTNTAVTINVHPVAFGKEEWRKIEEDDPDLRVDLINRPEDSVLQLIKAIHCNPRYPEFHTVYIRKREPKIAMVSNGETFVIADADKIIDKLYTTNRDRIDEPLLFPDLFTSQKFTDAIIQKHEDQALDEKFVKKVKSDVKSELIGMESTITQEIKTIKA